MSVYWQIIIVGKEVEILESSYTADGNGKWCKHFGKQCGSSTELPFCPPIVLLGIYPRELKTYVPIRTYTQILITAFFTIAKMWKPPKCPSTDEMYPYNGY